MSIIFKGLLRLIRKIYPNLKNDLYISGMGYSPETFLNLSLVSSTLLTAIFMIPITVIINLLKKPIYAFVSVIAPLVFIFLFMVILRIPSYNIKKLSSQMESEVAVTGRRLLIQLESGKSLVNALIDIGTKYQKGSSKSLERIAYQLYTGKPLEETIDDTIKNSPSVTFKKIFIQIKNSLKTGANLKESLKAALEDITRKKVVEFETFGNKLSPLGLFYMIFGTIVPSLGVVIFIVWLALVRIKITFTLLFVFLAFIAIIQLLFITIFSKMRPHLEI